MEYEDILTISLVKGDVISPLKHKHCTDHPVFKFVNDSERILFDALLNDLNKCMEKTEKPLSFEKARPEEIIYFKLRKSKVWIDTRYYLSQGLNNVARRLNLFIKSIGQPISMRNP